MPVSRNSQSELDHIFYQADIWEEVTIGGQNMYNIVHP